MKRASRWLFNVAAAVSLLLAVAIFIAWIRSYSGESFRWYYYARRMHAGKVVRTDQSNYIIVLNGGRLSLIRGWRDVPPRQPSVDLEDDGWNFMHSSWTRWLLPARPPAPSGVAFRLLSALGVYTRTDDSSLARSGMRPPANRPLWQYDEHYREISVPMWMPAVLAGILPLFWSRRWRRERRRQRALLAGRCTACGYDLSATVDRCPECGVVAESELIANPGL